MKRFRRTLAGAIALVSSVVIGMTTLTGCGAKESVVRDEKTINIRACIGGYGDSWLRALADKVVILLRRHRHPLHIANHRQDEWEIIPECRREAQMLLLDIGTQPQLIPGRV